MRVTFFDPYRDREHVVHWTRSCLPAPLAFPAEFSMLISYLEVLTQVLKADCVINIYFPSCVVHGAASPSRAAPARVIRHHEPPTRGIIYKYLQCFTNTIKLTGRRQMEQLIVLCRHCSWSDEDNLSLHEPLLTSSFCYPFTFP